MSPSNSLLLLAPVEASLPAWRSWGALKMRGKAVFTFRAFKCGKHFGMNQKSKQNSN